ncbi:hypothetical protein [Mobilicoccus sp.]|uniref:hypothetical protein n=1 Tax=Mobilicoccus sp. TaxID=2034349 RepID=UPI0028A2D885|nr:hypothetical protein [Mobilicoccus sp.]
MKRHLLIAAPALVLALAGCSGGQDQQAEGGQLPTAINQGTGTPPADPTPVESRTQGAAPGNAGEAEVKFTKCENTKSGVQMEAEITNTTKEKRIYIVTGLAYDDSKKSVASAALMSDPLDAGASAKVSGKSTSAVKTKGDLTCEASDINSMPQS